MVYDTSPKESKERILKNPVNTTTFRMGRERAATKETRGSNYISRWKTGEAQKGRKECFRNMRGGGQK